MAFATSGLQAAVTAEIAAEAAVAGVATMNPLLAFQYGFAKGADYAFPIDEAGAEAVAMATFLNTPANFVEAVRLQKAETAAIATESAGDAERTTENTAQETAVTAAGTAKTNSGF